MMSITSKSTVLFLLLLLFAWSTMAQTTIIPLGATWKYLDNGSNQGTAWRGVAFDDGSWKSGPAELGYGDGDEVTVVSYGPDSRNKYVTTYFRKEISITNAAQLTAFTGSIKRDDGAVVYVNGTEVYRTNMPSGTISYNTLAASGASNDDGKRVHTFTINQSIFVSGTNIIAVEIHQSSVRSSDISFDLMLTATTATTSQQQVTGFVLVNASTEQDIQSISNGTVINLSSLSSNKLNIRALTTPATVGSVYFELSGTQSRTYIDNKVPYALFGDNGTGNYYYGNWGPPPVGSYTLLATPYSEAEAGGTTGVPLSINFTIVNDGEPPANQAPAAVSINRYAPTDETTSATSVMFRITFSEAVTGVDVNDFSLRGTVNATIASVSGSGTTYNITVNNITGTGTLGLDLKSSGTGIIDADGNAISGGFTSGQTYTITTATPVDFKVIRGPYLQVGAQTAITLRWRTDDATDSRIDVGISFGNYTKSETNATVTREHEVRITGLTPGTKYYYRFGSSNAVLPGSSSQYFNTAPPANTTRKIRVVFFNDSGTSESAQENRERSVNAYLNYTGDNPAELLLSTGDNAEPDGTDGDYQNNFFNYFDPKGILKNHVLFTAPGNNEYHEFGRESKQNAYYKIFSMPTAAEGGGVPSGTQTYYSFNWGNIHFVSLDPRFIEADGTVLTDPSGKQATWLKKDLEANTQEWTIAFFHYPPYTMGSHNSDEEDALRRIRENVVPILEQYGVDLVVNGHSHNYERSYLLNNYLGNESDFSISADTKSSSSGRYDGSSNSCPYKTESRTANHGTVYVVAANYYALGSFQNSFPHAALPFTSRQGGVLYLEMQDNRLDAKFIRNDGAIADQFTIMHEVNKTNNITIVSGSSVQLTASWIGNYNWSTGSTSRSISVSPTSSTTYRVRDEQGCITDVFNVNVTSSDITSAKGRVLTETDAVPVVYPTRVKRGERVTVQTASAQLTEAAVVDNKGTLIKSLRFSGTTQVETQNLAAGMYLIIIRNQKKTSTQKFIVTD